MLAERERESLPVCRLLPLPEVGLYTYILKTTTPCDLMNWCILYRRLMWSVIVVEREKEVGGEERER